MATTLLRLPERGSPSPSLTRLPGMRSGNPSPYPSSRKPVRRAYLPSVIPEADFLQIRQDLARKARYPGSRARCVTIGRQILPPAFASRRRQSCLQFMVVTSGTHSPSAAATSGTRSGSRLLLRFSRRADRGPARPGAPYPTQIRNASPHGAKLHPADVPILRKLPPALMQPNPLHHDRRCPGRALCAGARIFDNLPLALRPQRG